MSGADPADRIESRGHRLVAAPGWRRALVALGFADAARFDEALDRATRVPGGRAPGLRIEDPTSGGRIRLRPVRRGGGLAAFLPAGFTKPERAERELALWLRLRDRGAPLPEPVAAVARRHGALWQMHFATLECPQAVDGQAWLATAPSRAAWAEGVSAFARALRRFHDAGAAHGDLHLRNVLFEPTPTGPRCLFVDLDHAIEGEPIVPAAARLGDLVRLARSLEKRGFGALVDRRLRARVLAAYCDGDRRLRAALLEARGAEPWRQTRHRLAWSLQKVFARSAGRGLSLGFLGIATLVAVAVVALVACDPPEAVGPATAPGDPSWSILAVGDTGRATRLDDPFEGQLAVAAGMTREAQRSPVEGLLLLGDNFYERGLSPEDWIDQVRRQLVGPYCHFLALTGPRSSEVADACAIPASQRRPVPIYAVLGNHDREEPVSVGLERTSIPLVVPDWQMGSGLTRVVELAPGLSLVLFESELAIDDRPAIEAALVEALRAAKGPWRILAAHRPIATDDLGGVPDGGYPDWVRDAIVRSGRAVQLVLCGHHHSLQAFALPAPTPLLQIGVGSGSRAERPLAHDHPDLLFSALELGFARIDRIGAPGAADERLAVSLFRVARWPWLARFVAPRRVALFVVDREGAVDDPGHAPRD